MKSPLSYLGGKSLIVTDIIKLIPEHTCFIDLIARGSLRFWQV